MISTIFRLRDRKAASPSIQPDDQPASKGDSTDQPDFTSEAAQRFHNWGVTR